MSNKFNPLHYSLEYEGKLVSKSQSHYTWIFDLVGKSHKVEFVYNALGRKQVILDSKQILSQSKHEFVIDSYNLIVFEDKDGFYDLSVDNISFKSIYNAGGGGGGQQQVGQGQYSSQQQQQRNQQYDAFSAQNSQQVPQQQQGQAFNNQMGGITGNQQQQYQQHQPQQQQSYQQPQQQQQLVQKAPMSEADKSFFNSDLDGEFNSSTNDFSWGGFQGKSQKTPVQNLYVDPAKLAEEAEQKRLEKIQQDSILDAQIRNPFASMAAGMNPLGISNPFGKKHYLLSGESESIDPSLAGPTINPQGAPGLTENTYLPSQQQQQQQQMGSNGGMAGQAQPTAPGGNSGDIFSSFGNQGSLVTSKANGQSTYNYVFQGQGNKSSPGLTQVDDFDQKYSQHISQQKEKGGSYNNTIKTEVERGVKTSSNVKNYHQPFGKNYMEVDGDGLKKGLKRGVQKVEAMLETFERKVKDGMKSLTHPKVLNHSAELSLNENMKNNSFGTNFNNISKGYNGEELDIGEFKFDDEFGGIDQAARQNQEKMNSVYKNQYNQQMGQIGMSNRGGGFQGDPFAVHSSQQQQIHQQNQQYQQHQQQQQQQPQSQSQNKPYDAFAPAPQASYPPQHQQQQQYQQQQQQQQQDEGFLNFEQNYNDQQNPFGQQYQADTLPPRYPLPSNNHSKNLKTMFLPIFERTILQNFYEWGLHSSPKQLLKGLINPINF